DAIPSPVLVADRHRVIDEGVCVSSDRPVGVDAWIVEDPRRVGVTRLATHVLGFDRSSESDLVRDASAEAHDRLALATILEPLRKGPSAALGALHVRGEARIFKARQHGGMLGEVDPLPAWQHLEAQNVALEL